MVAMAGILFAANLIANGDFEGPFDTGELRTMGDWVLGRDNGQGRWSQEVEDRTWNKCLKIELGEITGDRITYGVALGGDQETVGFSVKPETEYRLSFEARGDAPRFFNGVRQIGRKGVKDIRLKTSMPNNAAQPEWTKYTGTFRTQAGAERATLEFYFWGTGRNLGHGKDFQEKSGQYVLIDNVVVEEAKKPVFGAKAKTAAAPELPDMKARAFVISDEISLGAFENAVKSGQAAHHQVKTAVRASDRGVSFDCTMADPVLVSGVAGDGNGSIWKDDTIEFFFASPDPADPIRQYVVSSGGARLVVDGGDYASWQAKTERTARGWTVRAFFSWKALGYAQAPSSSEPVKFNIFSTRFVETKPGKFQQIDWSRGNGQRTCVLTDAVSVTCAAGKFRDMSRWPVFFVGSMDGFVERSLAALTEPEAKKLAAKLDRGDPSACYSTLLSLQKLNRAVKLSKERFIVTEVPVTTDTAIPYLPDELNEPKSSVKVRAAVNDRAIVTFAVANMQKAADSFRVGLDYAMEQFPGSDVYPLEGLRAADGSVIDGARIELRAGVRYRDSDAKERGARYDPMGLLGETSSVVVPCGEAGLIALIVDCRGLKPGVYRGRLGVTPLVGGTFKNVTYYRPDKDKPRRLYTIQDDTKFVDVELEILPFALKADAPRMAMAGYKPLYRPYQRTFAQKWDIVERMVTPWAFKCPYGKDGKRLADDTAAWLGEILAGYRTITTVRAGERPYFIGYSVYSVYKRACKGMKAYARLADPDDAGYWAGFRDWLQYIAATLAKYGIDLEQTTWEIQDEPQDKNWDHAEIVRAFREARAALPEMDITCTYGEVDFFDELAPLVDHWIFQASSYDNAELRKRIERFRAMPNKRTTTYRCSTSPRLDPYSYYRLLAWNAAAAGGSVSHLYQLYDGETAANLRKVTYGGVAYDTGHALVPSIRFLQYQQGLGDVRYLKELEALAQDKDTPEAKEALTFVKKAYREAVIVHPHDTTVAGRLRDEAIERILKLK